MHHTTLHPELHKLKDLSHTPLTPTGARSAQGIIVDPAAFAGQLQTRLPGWIVASKDYGAVVFANLKAGVLVTVYPDRLLELDLVEGLDTGTLNPERTL